VKRINLFFEDLSLLFVGACSMADRSQEKRKTTPLPSRIERPDTERAIDAARKPNKC
jgi:hypothetical protein